MLSKLSWLWDTAPQTEEVERLNQIIIDQQEQINELQRKVGTCSINILNPQNKRFYSNQEGIQDVVDSLFNMYEHTSKRCNTLMEQSFKRS